MNRNRPLRLDLSSSCVPGWIVGACWRRASCRRVAGRSARSGAPIDDDNKRSRETSSEPGVEPRRVVRFSCGPDPASSRWRERGPTQSFWRAVVQQFGPSRVQLRQLTPPTFNRRAEPLRCGSWTGHCTFVSERDESDACTPLPPIFTISQLSCSWQGPLFSSVAAQDFRLNGETLHTVRGEVV